MSRRMVARARMVTNMDHCAVRTRSFHFVQGPAMVACIINPTLCHVVGGFGILIFYREASAKFFWLDCSCHLFSVQTPHATTKAPASTHSVPTTAYACLATSTPNTRPTETSQQSPFQTPATWQPAKTHTLLTPQSTSTPVSAYPTSQAKTARPRENPR